MLKEERVVGVEGWDGEQIAKMRAEGRASSHGTPPGEVNIVFTILKQKERSNETKVEFPEEELGRKYFIITWIRLSHGLRFDFLSDQIGELSKKSSCKLQLTCNLSSYPKPNWIRTKNVMI